MKTKKTPEAREKGANDLIPDYILNLYSFHYVPPFCLITATRLRR